MDQIKMSDLSTAVIGNASINPFTLSFTSDEFNDAFRIYYIKKTLKLARLSLLLASCLYLLFGFLDEYVVPEAADTILHIRISCALFCLVLLALISSPAGKKNLQLITSIAVLIGGSGIVWMILLAEASGGYFYYAGLMLVIMWAHGALRLRFVFATMTTLSVIVVYEVVAIYIKTTPLSIVINNTFFLVSAFILGMFSSYGLEYFMRIAFWQTQKLNESRQKMESEHIRKSKELEAARQIQLAMLPKSFPDHPTVEIAATMKTATEIGGDYYDFQLSRENVLTFAIGDATGHGAQAGSIVTAIKILFSNWSHDLDLVEFLQKASKSIRKMGQPKLFMALVVGRIRERTLELAGAGLPSALVYRALSGQVEQISLKGIPLGSFADVSYKKMTVELAEDDVVMFMTDGFPELFNEEGKMAGEEKAISALSASASMGPAEILDYLGKVAINWINGYPQHDDITFLALKIKNGIRNSPRHL
jgi:hypothetical protein